MTDTRKLSRARIDELVELADASQARRGQLADAIRADREIAAFKPEAECRIDPRDGMPIVYSLARARRPHDTTPAKAATVEDPSAADCPVCAGKTTGILDKAAAGTGITFINKNLFPVVYPADGPCLEVTGEHSTATGERACGGHYLQWTSDRHDTDLHNASYAHVTVVLERLAAFELALLRSGTDLPKVGEDKGAALHGYVGIIKNRGHAVGGSLVHGHQQIVHTNVRPQRTAQHQQFMEREARSFARFVLDETPRELVIADTGDVVAVTPFFLRRPLQAFILIKDTRKSYLHQLSRRELSQLARALRRVCGTVMEAMPRIGREPAYNLVFHTGPIGGMYVEMLPWSQQYGGYEQLGLFICQGTPESSHRLYVDGEAR